MVFLIDASPAMLRRAPGATTHAVDGARPDASSSNAHTGRGGAGSIAPSALEQSTVDLADEFTRMIVTQRAFSASTRIITTADEMLEELTRIVR